MAIEEKHHDILYSIESALINVYRRNPGMKDANVLKAVQELVAFYRVRVMKRDVPEPRLSEIEMEMYRAVINALELRQGFEGSEFPEVPEKKRFSRVFKQKTPDEIYMACLRRIEQSIKRWTSRNGIRGYLDFVKGYV